MVLRPVVLILLIISTNGSEGHIKGDLGQVIERSHHVKCFKIIEKDFFGNLDLLLFQGWHFLVSGLTRQDLGLGPTRGPRQIIGSRCYLSSSMHVWSNLGCRAT